MKYCINIASSLLFPLFFNIVEYLQRPPSEPSIMAELQPEVVKDHTLPANQTPSYAGQSNPIIDQTPPQPFRPAAIHPTAAFQVTQ